MLRVTSVKGPEWMSNERRILHKLAKGARAHHPTNHTLPILDEFTIGNVVFTVFPYVMCSVHDALDALTTSADDYINIVLQMLEVGIRLLSLFTDFTKRHFRQRFIFTSTVSRTR